MKSRFPFTSFPNGWFFVGFSKELQPGEVKPIQYFGKELVLLRTKDGTAHVLDAHCPHLGAHLGYGGKVIGNKIQCPFHGWCFDSKGKCVDIPYASKIPPKAQIRSWVVREVNGLIMFYYHAQEESPSWEIPELPEFKSEQWTTLSDITQFKVRSCPYQIIESAADIGHFRIVNQNSRIELDNLYTDDHVLKAYYSKPQNFLGAEADNTELQENFEITLYGLGYNLQRFGQKSKQDPGKLILLILVTPIDYECTEVHVILSMKKCSHNAQTSSVLEQTLNVFRTEAEKEIPIIENRAYLKNPLLCEVETGLPQYWNWARKFFSEETVTTKIPVKQGI